MTQWFKSSNKNKRPVRSSQLITTWGIGSIQSFPNNDSFMLLGLDAWNYLYEQIDHKKIQEHTIIEPRLARRLKVKDFRKPLIFDKDIDEYSTSMPYVRFPSWHICPNCGSMKQIRAQQKRNIMNSKDTICDTLS